MDNAVWRRFDTKIDITLPDETIRHELIHEFLKGYPNKISVNEKSMGILVEITDGYSPADIKTIVNSAFKKAIIEDRKNISLKDLLYEILVFENSGNIDIENGVNYLRKYNVTQKNIAETLKISVRQVRNHLQEG